MLYMHRPLNLSVSFAAMITLVAANASRAAELKVETVSAWQDYIQKKDAAVKWTAQQPWPAIDDSDDCTILRSGKILVAPIGPHTPKRVPEGLIHDWIGTIFIPNATISDVLAAVRDYDRYKDIYRPGVVDSKLVSSGDEEDRFSLLLMNSAVVMKKAIEGEYHASYFRIDDHRWYSIAEATRVQEVENYGGANERLLREDHGTGLIWRLHSITRYEEQDGGVYMQLEAIALSRIVPGALRWMIDPIVRRVSRNSLQLSLSQTRGAVKSKLVRAEALNKNQEVR
jgi:hypothetical protein